MPVDSILKCSVHKQDPELVHTILITLYNQLSVSYCDADRFWSVKLTQILLVEDFVNTITATIL